MIWINTRRRKEKKEEFDQNTHEKSGREDFALLYKKKKKITLDKELRNKNEEYNLNTMSAST